MDYSFTTGIFNQHDTPGKTGTILPGRHRFVRSVCSILLLVGLPAASGLAQVSVLTEQNDNARTSANLNETVLNTTNVNVNQFGLLLSRSIDGYLYAQPLYVPNVPIPGMGTHNVVYVATLHNTVWAFDADQPDQATPYWSINLGPSQTPAPADFPFLIPEIGIVGTPVIDPVTSTLYVVAATFENGSYYFRLHALDITNGQEKSGAPVVIQGSVPGEGYDNVGGVVTFKPRQQIQRAGLLLANGAVYIAFASYDDIDPYHGWIFGYSASNVQQQTLIFNNTPNGSRGGIWQSGVGLAADANGYVYSLSGNGDYDGATNFADSIVKLNTAGAVVDWFTPDDQATRESDDADLGSSGPLLIPNTSLLIGGGKLGFAYVVDSGNMGHFSSSDSQIVQEFRPTPGGLFNHLAYWNRTGSPLLYTWGSGDVLRAFSFSNGAFNTTAVAQGGPKANFPGGVMALSANAGTAGTGIIWATIGASNSHGATVPGMLAAYDASNVATELWDSNQNAARDGLGNFAKFTSPTVANGKVYAPTFSNQLNVYGLLSAPAAGVSIWAGPTSVTLSTGGQQQFTATVSGTASTGVTWSMSPAVGTLSANGLYTAPVPVSAPLTVTITATSVADPTKSATTSVVLNPAIKTTGTASFVVLDTTTQGNWQGIYGSDGYNVVNDAVAYPSYVNVTPSQASSYTWAASTSDMRALSDAPPVTGRTAATWFSNTDAFSVNLAFRNNLPREVAIYCLDWDSTARAETINILDANNILLATQNVTGFHNGQYLVWQLSGNVTIQVVKTAGANPVISGLFFDPFKTIPAMPIRPNPPLSLR